MEFINIGKIVNTHGIKGELRILSDFRHKDKVFKVGMKFYVGKEKEEFTVNSYRFHKIFDMVTFVGFNNINDVLYLKGKNVFINKEDLIMHYSICFNCYDIIAIIDGISKLKNKIDITNYKNGINILKSLEKLSSEKSRKELNQIKRKKSRYCIYS